MSDPIDEALRGLRQHDEAPIDAEEVWAVRRRPRWGLALAAGLVALSLAATGVTIWQIGRDADRPQWAGTPSASATVSPSASSRSTTSSAASLVGTRWTLAAFTGETTQPRALLSAGEYLELAADGTAVYTVGGQSHTSRYRLTDSTLNIDKVGCAPSNAPESPAYAMCRMTGTDGRVEIVGDHLRIRLAEWSVIDFTATPGFPLAGTKWKAITVTEQGKATDVSSVKTSLEFANGERVGEASANDGVNHHSLVVAPSADQLLTVADAMTQVGLGPEAPAAWQATHRAIPVMFSKIDAPAVCDWKLTGGELVLTSGTTSVTFTRV